VLRDFSLKHLSRSAVPGRTPYKTPMFRVNTRLRFIEPQLASLQSAARGEALLNSISLRASRPFCYNVLMARKLIGIETKFATVPANENKPKKRRRS
jgi:hypothetical protein